jgi:hypothetical protein
VYRIMKLKQIGTHGVHFSGFPSLPRLVGPVQGVTKRCRLSWLTSRALVYEPICGGMGEGRGCGVLSSEYSCAHGAQINFGDHTPYLAFGSVQENISLLAGNVPLPLATQYDGSVRLVSLFIFVYDSE